MHYDESPPPPDLALDVRRFWSLSDAPPGSGRAPPRPIERVIPDGRMELIVHLGDRFAEVAHDRAAGRFHAARPQPRALLAGQIAGPLFLQPGRAIDLFAIRFEPWGAAALLGVDAAALAERIVPLDDVVGAAAGKLVDVLAAARGEAARVEAASRWLRERARLGSPSRAPAWLHTVVRAAQREPERHTVATLAALAGSGRRDLDRRFARHVGLAPKPFLRVARVQQTLAALEARPDAPLAVAALARGYCDQGHFTRDFGALTGTTPARFLRERRGLETLLLDAAPPAAAFISRA